MIKINIFKKITKPFKCFGRWLNKKITNFFYKPLQEFEEREKGYECRKEFEKMQCEDLNCNNMKEYFKKLCDLDPTLDFDNMYTNWCALEARFANGRLKAANYRAWFNQHLC